MGVLGSSIHGQLAQLYGQVNFLFSFQTFHITFSKRYTLASVLIDFSKDMCPEEEDGCSASKEGLLQTALVVVYLLVIKCFNQQNVIQFHFYRQLQCLDILEIGILENS